MGGRTIVVDLLGPGGVGVQDGLKALEYNVKKFNASMKARDTGKYLDARAESYFGLAKALEEGTINHPEG